MKRFKIILFLLITTLVQVFACTTAIISGKYTLDGRPLLYKHRDTGKLQNKLMPFNDGKYSYIGIVNSSDAEGKEVWGGYNSAGFAIMNSASYNLNPDEEGKPELEGVVMKLALQQCATVDDFQRLLDSLPKPMYVSANFGVIDAQGNGAYFEAGDYEYVKFDVNDATIAPMGYIIRTNYSYSGDRERDKGISRYMAAEPLFYQAALTNNLSYRFLLKDVSRHLTHGLTGNNLYESMTQQAGKPLFIPFRDFIPRYSTASVIVVQGINKDETPDMTTMWTMLGSPLSAVTIPVWLNKDNHYPTVLTADETGNAKLCDWSLQIKKDLFPITRGEGNDYINLAALISDDGNGILHKTLLIENQILDNADKMLGRWKNEKQDLSELNEFNNWVDQYVTEAYHQIFNLTP